ncbi:MAG: hypothetical protein E6H38_07475 [Betaproteobacteria bacterium]|nr:MAG: hypothetical protein E6H38_07475 [Betaproteobacteria bacterium]
MGGEINDSIYHLMHFVKDVFFDSQTTVGLLSNATLGVFPPGDPNGRAPNSIEESQAAGVLNAKQTAAVRDFVNRISGSQRMLAHGQLYPGRRSLYFMEQQVAENHPDAWKGYTVATSARGDNDPPDSPLKQWRLDDEQIAYPSYDFIMRQRDQLRRHPGFRNICIHKGFSPAPIDTPEWGKPTDIPKASHDWPELNFIIYHACFGGMTPFLWPSPGLANIQNKVLRNGEPDITWLTEFAQTCGKIRNVYAEIGSTFGGIVITFPSVCAHLLGQLLKHFGEDKIVFGSDCIYYGSPQWQIEAMWRHRARQAQDPRAKFGAALRRVGGCGSFRARGLPSGAAQLRYPGAAQAEDAARVSRPDHGRDGEGAPGVPGSGRRPEPPALRLGAHRSLERAEIVVAELELLGGDVFFEVSDRRGAGDRQHDRRLGEQPGDAYLRGRGPKFFAGLQHVFRIAIAQAVAVLHRDDRHDFPRLLELLDGHVRDADVADLAFALHVGERAERNLERHLRIDRMELIEIDALQPQALQAAFQILLEFFGSAVRVPAAGARSRYAAFAADDEAFRIGMQGFGDQDLAGMRAVAFGGVEEVDAEL